MSWSTSEFYCQKSIFIKNYIVLTEAESTVSSQHLDDDGHSAKTSHGSDSSGMTNDEGRCGEVDGKLLSNHLAVVS